MTYRVHLRASLEERGREVDAFFVIGTVYMPPWLPDACLRLKIKNIEGEGILFRHKEVSPQGLYIEDLHRGHITGCAVCATLDDFGWGMSIERIVENTKCAFVDAGFVPADTSGNVLNEEAERVLSPLLHMRVLDFFTRERLASSGFPNRWTRVRDVLINKVGEEKTMQELLERYSLAQLASQPKFGPKSKAALVKVLRDAKLSFVE